MKIGVLALDGVFDTGLATVLDAFTTANELAAARGLDGVHFDVAVCGLRRSVRTAQGLAVPVLPAGQATRLDWLVVPALGVKTPGPVAEALDRRDVREACALLREADACGTQVAAACIGTFVLAESGLLDGSAATTTWWLAAMFRERYPQVALDDAQMLVRSGRWLTAGAALGHIDMALWLVRQESPDVAALTASHLVVDDRPSQSAYAIGHHLAHTDPLVSRFEQWARSRIEQPFSVDDAAASLSVSKRTLQRRVAGVLGKTPLQFVQDLRVEQAVHLLKTTRLDIEHIAARVGYADGVTLRALLQRRLGRGIREIRGRRG